MQTPGSVGPCLVLGQHRIPRVRDDEHRLVADMIELASQYGRYGYRRIAALLRGAGWQINDKRVERLWQREGLKVPGKQPKRAGSGKTRLERRADPPASGHRARDACQPARPGDHPDACLHGTAASGGSWA